MSDQPVNGAGDTIAMVIDRPEMTASDPEAPHGRNVDGSPKKKPGPAKGSPQRGGRLGTGRKSSAPRPPRPPRPKAPAKTDYRPGISGMLQLVAVPLAFTQPLDAAAVAMHTPPIAEALNNLAHTRPEVAAVLDKILEVGPYGELIAAVLPLAAQLAENHKMLPGQMAAQLGAVPREALEAELRRRSETEPAA